MDIVVTTPETIRAEIKQALSDCLAELNLIAPAQPQPEAKFIHSINELAEFLNCSPVTAQKLKNSGKIRFRQFGRKFIINTAELMQDLGNARRGKY